MRIYGLDFTSAPGRKKPLISLACAFDGHTLRVEGALEMDIASKGSKRSCGARGRGCAGWTSPSASRPP